MRHRSDDRRYGRRAASDHLTIGRLAAALLFVCGAIALDPASVRGEQAGCDNVDAVDFGVVITCTPGFASASDRIEVYSKNRRPLTSDPKTWFDESVALFYVGSADRPSLIIDFSHEADAAVAHIYQDGDGDGMVAYSTENGHPVARENGDQWAIEVRTTGGNWWLPDGKVNYNLRIRVDGSIRGTIDFRLYQDLLKTDGTVDLTVDVRDENGNGRPEVEWRQSYPPLPEDSGYYRTNIMRNMDDDEVPPVGSIVWPYLGSMTGGLVKDQGPLPAPPPIQVDWATGRVPVISEFVGSRLPGNYFVYSITRIEPGSVAQADFENPFVYYDLSGANDGYMDMSIRIVNFFAGDQFGWSKQQDDVWTHVMYTWDREHDRRWDYQLALMAHYSAPDVVSAGDLRYRSVDYHGAPQWVTERPWEAALFVEVERPAYFNNEHVYEWSGESSILDRCYLQGTCVGDWRSSFRSIPVGFRGEVAVPYDRLPETYFSPIDRALHLVGADLGVWNVGEKRVIRYLNTTGGDTIDGWQVWDDNYLTAELYRVPGGLIYSDLSGSWYRALDTPDELFRSGPPRNNEEWRLLDELLRANEREFAPGDLRAMFDQFGGTPIQIAAGPLRDFRRLDNGAYFVVDVHNDQTRANLTALAGVPPATDVQVVELRDGRWWIESASFATPDITIEVDSVRSLSNTRVGVTMANAGNVDVADVTIEVRAVAPDGSQMVLLTERGVALTGGVPWTRELNWSPPLAGDWRVEVEVRRQTVGPYDTEGPVLLAEQSVPVVVAPAPRLGFTDGAELGWGGDMSTRVLGFLALPIAAALVSLVVVRRTGRQD
jgi:hypothetical protein